MFDVGSWYDIITIEGESGRVESYGWLVTEVDGPRIKIEQEGKTKILNTASPEFVSAKLSEYQSGERPVVVVTNYSQAP